MRANSKNNPSDVSHDTIERLFYQTAKGEHGVEMSEKEENRAKEFLKCLGRGSSIIEIQQEDDE